MVVSSFGIDDALLRKLISVVDVKHTKKGLKPKRKCQKRTEEKKNLLKNLTLAVVPLVRPVVPLRR